MRIGIKMTDINDVASVDLTNQNLIHMQTKIFRKLEKHHLCGHQGKNVQTTSNDFCWPSSLYFATTAEQTCSWHH